MPAEGKFTVVLPGESIPEEFEAGTPPAAVTRSISTCGPAREPQQRRDRTHQRSRADLGYGHITFWHARLNGHPSDSDNSARTVK